MAEKKKKSRIVRAVKAAANKPAEFAPVKDNPAFDAKAVAERLNIWRMSTGTATYFGPMLSGDDWREMSSSDLRRALRAEGVQMHAQPPQFLSEADMVAEHIQHFRQVDFAGPLAGYKAGVHRGPNGKPFIVRGGPTLIKPEEGDWSLIRQILEPRFQDDAGPQLDYFQLWLKCGMEPLYKGRRRKGPMLIFTGLNDSGKSFIQHHIITPLFGGREFDPTDFFKNDAGFNKYMMASEHLAIGEFAFPLDGASRLMLSEKFKKIVANDSQTYHPKGRDAMTIHPHLRLSISINDNDEKIHALPPMNNDLADKVLLLKVRGGLPMPMPTDTDEQEAAFAEAVRAQLPAFAHYLLAWQPPEAIAHGRLGMKVWQHPQITDALWEQEPVSRFAFLLDRELFPSDQAQQWEAWGWGKAVALHEQVTASDALHSAQFRSVAKHEGAFSQMLGMLFKRESAILSRERGVKPDELDDADPARRYCKRHDNKRGNFWLLRPPPQ